MIRFLLSAMPFTGHVAPLLAVADALVAAGHDVRFHTGSAFAEHVAAAGAVHVPWQAAPDFHEQNLAATFPRLIGRKGMRQVFINLTDVMIGTAPDQVDDLQREWRRQPWDVLVAEETSIGARLFAERIGCPHATVAVLPLNLPATSGPPPGLALTPGAGPIGRARDAVLRAWCRC